MELYSIDFGGSTVDLIRWSNAMISKINSYERHHVSTQSLGNFFSDQVISLEGIEEIRVTGGDSRKYEDQINDIPVIRVDEIQAIGQGGTFLLEQELGHASDCLTISMGTGTCMVAAQEGVYRHIGGTGVGGGTFLSLCSLILQEGDPQKLVELFAEGDSRKVDLSVGEIVGSGIGRVSAEVTASNLGKLVRSEEIDFSRADLAAGLINLIGQTIATAAVFASKSEDLIPIVLTGKLTRIQPIVDVIFEVGRLYDRPIILPKDGEFVAAIGAAM